MSKEDLIIFLLKSKQRIAKLFNKNLGDDKISDIRRTLNRLRDILHKKYRKEIKKKLYEIENEENLSKLEKEDSPYDRDDFDYYGIRDIENVFDKVNEEEYY